MRLSFFVPSALLRQQILLISSLANRTKWSLTYNMLKRQPALRLLLAYFDYVEVEEILLNGKEGTTAIAFLERSDDSDSATLRLLFDASSLSDDNALFNGVVDRYPHLKNTCYALYYSRIQTLKKNLLKCSVAMKMLLRPLSRKILLSFVAMAVKVRRSISDFDVISTWHAETIYFGEGRQTFQLPALTIYRCHF